MVAAIVLLTIAIIDILKKRHSLEYIGGYYMKVISIILIVIGAIGLLLSTMMFGDIGLAAGIASITAILSGVNFLNLNKKISTN